ncbi:MAG: PspC domain-containing protein, partial [Bacteroidota bacterium]|nr:PspC domain-containing protein [Bacteroidota bacterium]
MKKNFTINIKGIIFNIDDDAFDKLNDYLNRLKQHFSTQESGEDVVSDIEARIAELLQERINDKKQVITIEDIEQIIKILGEPYEMDENEAEEEKPSHSSFRPKTKQLFRDPDNRIIGGVGGGLGTYFNTDPLWFRLLFVASFFATGPLTYLIFWIAVPLARTTSDRLNMKGKKINIDNIEKSVKEEVKNVSESFNNYTGKAKES